jgi:hypothetical protein
MLIYFCRRKKCQKNLKKMELLARTLLFQNCANIIDFMKNIVFSQDFLHRHRKSEKDFTRKRKLPFPTLIVFLIDLATGSYQNELNRFFRLLVPSDLPKRFVSKVALTKARMKLGYEAFVDLNERIAEYFYQNMPANQWHGYNLLAVDGTLLRLPKIESIMKHFGVWHTKGDDRPMARVSQMFDPLNRVSVDTIISPKSEGERELAARHFFKLTIDDLVLLDRGYPAYWLFNLIMSMGSDFCARVSAKKWKIIRKFVNSGKHEIIISLPVFPSSVEKCKELGLELRSLKLRLVRVELDSGEVEVLITSLTDKTALPHECFAELYHLRWPVEEDYKKMKSWIEIENFSGKSIESVYQDFYAKVFAKNLTAILASTTSKDIDAVYETRKYLYQINYAQAYAEMKRMIPLLFLRSKGAVSEIISALREFLIQTVEPIRPGRKFPRKKGQPRNYYLNYKSIC